MLINQIKYQAPECRYRVNTLLKGKRPEQLHKFNAVSFLQGLGSVSRLVRFVGMTLVRVLE